MIMLVGALVGLLGQETAFANSMPLTWANQNTDAGAMDPGCAEMMGVAQPDKPEKPCEGMTPECVAKMGCAVPVALVPLLPITEPMLLHAWVPARRPVATLTGRIIGPEPEPPTPLA